MEFRPIKPKKIYEEIVEQIQALMAEGDIKPGDKLLSERELAEKLEVSRASVREALRSLEMMGFVEIKTGEGTYVKKSSATDIIQPLAMFMSIEGGSLIEVYELRKIIESGAANLAAQRATPEELSKIAKALEEMRLSISDSAHGEYSDTAFHFQIALATHNSWLVRLMQTISGSFHNTVAAARAQLFLTPGNVEKLFSQHKLIYEAIQEGDSQKAANAMLEHLRFAEAEMAKTLTAEE